MDLAELQAVWDSRRGRQLCALDLDALHASVRRKARGVARGVNAMELGMIGITIFLAAYLAYEPLVERTDLHQLVGAALMLAVALLHVVGRRRRRARDAAFEPSLRGELERALSQVEYHMRRARTFQWWFLAPAFAITLITYLVEREAKAAWYWPLMLGCMALALVLVRMEVRCVHAPKKRALEALRAELLSGG